VAALTVVTAAGETVVVRRPGLEKNTAGYELAHDPVDWFVGSEGTLGVITEVEFRLLPLPAAVVGLAVPFASEDDALRFVVAAREAPALRARCLEFLDAGALEIAREAAGDPGWAAGARALVYAEDEAAPGADAEPDLDAWLAAAEAHGAVDGDVRVYDSDAAIREARRMRHAVPAAMHERGARRRPFGGRRVSTDWAVPHRRLAEALAAARAVADAHGVAPAVTFGHAGNGHPHQNYVAHDAAELARVERVVEETLRIVVGMGGTVAAEHGIGKLKRRWLPLQLSPLQLGVMRAVKRELDPAGILAPGNVL
jgi:FAD/FMN-containing dehydrogenase